MTVWKEEVSQGFMYSCQTINIIILFSDICAKYIFFKFE